MSEPNTWQDGMATETDRWPHNTAFPGGSVSQAVEVDDRSQKADRGGRITNFINHPLPWCVIATAVAFLAFGLVISDHARIGDNVEHQTALIQNAENRALDAQQNALITEQKCNSLEIEMARHGVVVLPLVKK